MKIKKTKRSIISHGALSLHDRFVPGRNHEVKVRSNKRCLHGIVLLCGLRNEHWFAYHTNHENCKTFAVVRSNLAKAV